MDLVEFGIQAGIVERLGVNIHGDGFGGAQLHGGADRAGRGAGPARGFRQRQSVSRLTLTQLVSWSASDLVAKLPCVIRGGSRN